MISVVVPVYNTEKYLKRCLDSILSQSLKDIEIILINDGSTDNSHLICEDYANKYSNIKYISKKNCGLVSTWKLGVELATNEYIGFVDSDDYCSSDFFEELYGKVKEDKPDIIMGGFTSVTEDGNYPHKNNLPSGIYSGKELEEIKTNYFSNESIIINSRWTKLIKKEILINNMKYIDDDITLCEDLCISFASVLDSKSIAVVENYGYNYVLYNSSMSHGFNKKLIKNYLIFHNILNNIKQDKGYSGSLAFELVRQYLFIVVLILQSNNSLSEKYKLLKDFRNKKQVKASIANVRGLKTSQKITNLLFKFRFYLFLIFLSKIWKSK